MITLTFQNITIMLPGSETLYVLESAFVRYYGQASAFTNTYQNRKVYYTRDTTTGNHKIQVMFA